MNQVLDFPCKDCITLPICKGQMGNLEYGLRTAYFVTEKCSLIKKYLRQGCTEFPYTYNVTAINTMCNFFKKTGEFSE